MTPIDFDPAKNQINRGKHGIDLSEAERFDFDSALIVADDRINYGETREVATGFIGDRLFVLVFTRRASETGEDIIRAISLRKATRREYQVYDENT